MDASPVHGWNGTGQRRTLSLSRMVAVVFPPGFSSGRLSARWFRSHRRRRRNLILVMSSGEGCQRPARLSTGRRSNPFSWTAKDARSYAPGRGQPYRINGPIIQIRPCACRLTCPVVLCYRNFTGGTDARVKSSRAAGAFSLSAHRRNFTVWTDARVKVLCFTTRN